MKELDNVKYFNIDEIFENIFHKKIEKEEILEYFDKGKLIGKKFDNLWHADEEAIDDFIKNVYLNEKAYNVGLQKIDLSTVALNGKILDIGGGGEGIIGQFKGESVISIDQNKNELEESPSKYDLKIVMNAKDLKFVNNSFETVTSFFTLMYIPREDHVTIFKEVYRILKKHGEFVIWDAVIPSKRNDDRTMFFISLEVYLGDHKVSASYGVSWNKELNKNYLSNIAEDIGFEILESKEEENTFFIRFRKT